MGYEPPPPHVSTCMSFVEMCAFVAYMTFVRPTEPLPTFSVRMIPGNFKRVPGVMNINQALRWALQNRKYGIVIDRNR